MSSVVNRDRDYDDRPEPKREAEVGDLIDYRFTFMRWGVEQSASDVRKVIAIDRDPGTQQISSYTVEGDWAVLPKQVTSIISADKSQPQTSDVGYHTSEFPLEPGQ